MLLNQTSYGADIEYALSNFKANCPELVERMKWENVTVAMSHRLRRAAGRSKYWGYTGKVLVELSESLYAGMSEHERRMTIVHELAHAVCQMLNLDHGHGLTWKDICTRMGGDAKRILISEAKVKMNLVRRTVVCDTSEDNKLRIVTPNHAAKLLVINRKMVILGDIEVDWNVYSYKWRGVVSDELRTLPILDNAKWKLVS